MSKDVYGIQKVFEVLLTFAMFTHTCDLNAVA